VSPLSLLTFFAAAKKVSAAPHRGNTSEPETQRGCQRKSPSGYQRKKPNPTTSINLSEAKI
jgi:general secretion pathway protein K